MFLFFHEQEMGLILTKSQAFRSTPLHEVQTWIPPWSSSNDSFATSGRELLLPLETPQGWWDSSSPTILWVLSHHPALLKPECSQVSLARTPSPCMLLLIDFSPPQPPPTANVHTLFFLAVNTHLSTLYSELSPIASFIIKACLTALTTVQLWFLFDTDWA